MSLIPHIEDVRLNLLTRFAKIFKPDRRLGSDKGVYKYDLPLDKSKGTDFIILLVGLMSFLAIITLAGAYILNDVSVRWSSGLEGKVTVEISPENADGTLLTNSQMDELVRDVRVFLSKQSFIDSTLF